MSSTLLRHSGGMVKSSQSESMTANYRLELETSWEEVWVHPDKLLEDFSGGWSIYAQN